jgi:SAM-dependent methyltransferase
LIIFLLCLIPASEAPLAAPPRKAAWTMRQAEFCRLCGCEQLDSVIDLGLSPLSNAFLPAADDANAPPEPRYPLHLRTCRRCHLAQLAQVVTPHALFSEYPYFSSVSESWLRHAAAFAREAIERFGLGARSRVIEVASNDGYLLRNFAAAGVPVLGIEPAANVAAVAQAHGVPTRVAFFGRTGARALCREGHGEADLVVANNVLAHVPELNDFIAGLALLLAPSGVLSIEVPHLLRLLEDTQYDTIYHEHFSYFSLLTAERALARHGLRVFDVETLATHGGSLRLLACRAAALLPAERPSIEALRRRERLAGLDGGPIYAAFASRAVAARRRTRAFFEAARRGGRRVVGYGAPAKGNTLLNFCGISPEMMAFTVDRSPHKQGLLLPGTRIPIRDPAAIAVARPDYLLILPWNLADEITSQMAGIAAWGGRFVVPVPRLRVLG